MSARMSKKCDWSASAKVECFNDLYRHCFDNNFGTLAKAEFEAILFHHYLKDLKARNGASGVSDYEIGRELGLTLARVRSLRERDQLKWPPEKFDWKEELVKCLTHAVYDEKSGMVKFIVPDVNVLKEFRYKLEQLCIYDEYQLNPKLVQCKLELFVQICFAIDDKTKCKPSESARSFVAALSSSNDDAIGDETYRHQNPGKAKIVRFLNDIAEYVPGGGIASRALTEVYRIYKNAKKKEGK